MCIATCGDGGEDRESKRTSSPALREAHFTRHRTPAGAQSLEEVRERETARRREREREGKK